MRNRQKNPRGSKHADVSKEARIIGEKDLKILLEKTENPLVLVLDCVQDPHNLGACLRTSDGAGVTAVVIPKDKSVSVTETVKKVACGAAETVPLHRATNLARSLKLLQDAGLWLVGTSDAADKYLYDVDLKGPTAIVMGAEGAGMRRLTEDGCDFLVKLPMFGDVPCLNVSVATGVSLYEAVRQRGGF